MSAVLAGGCVVRVGRGAARRDGRAGRVACGAKKDKRKAARKAERKAELLSVLGGDGEEEDEDEGGAREEGGGAGEVTRD